MSFSLILKSSTRFNLLLHTTCKLHQPSSFLQTHLDKINSSRASKGYLPKRQYLNLIRYVEANKTEMQPTHALQLIALCNNQLVELFPSERQKLLNHTFRDLLPKQNVQYSTDHLKVFMENTRSNSENFDPYLMLEEITKLDVTEQKSPSFAAAITEQFWETNQRKTALAYFTDFLENKVISHQSDIETMKNNSSSVSEESSLGNLLKRLESVESNVDYTESLNVFLDTSVKKDLLKFIKPNERTHISLVNSHVKMGQFESAIQVLNEQKDTISVSGLLSIYLKLNETDCSKSFEQSLNNVLSEKLTQLNGDQESVLVEHRVSFINAIMILCQENKFERALHLIKTHFSRDLDDTSLNILNTANYFVRSLVKFKDYQTIVGYVTRLDKGRNYNHLKKLAYLSHLKTDDENKLNWLVFDELKRLEVPVNTEYFYPLINKAAGDRQLKRVKDLFALMRNEYACSFNRDNLTSIVGILLRYPDASKVIAALFKKDAGTNHNMLFNIYANQVLDNASRNRSVKNGPNMREEDLTGQSFNSLRDMLSQLKVDYLEPGLLRRLTSNITGLSSKMSLFLTDDLDSNPILSTLRLINERTCSDPRFKMDDWLKKLNNAVYYEFLTNCPEADEKKRLNEFFSKNRILCSENADQLLKEQTNDRKLFRESRYEIEEEKLSELLKKEKSPYATMRRLVIAICKDFEHKRIQNHGERIAELIGQLPESELTPALCHELMRYFVIMGDVDKAREYYGKMMKVMSNEFEISREIILDYVQATLKQNRSLKKYDLEEAVAVFDANQWKPSTTDNKKQISKQQVADEKLTTLLKDLYNRTRKQPDEFKALTQAVLKSNFSQDKRISEMALLKLLTANQFEAAFDYYKQCSETIDKSGVFGLLLVRHFIKEEPDKKSEDKMAVVKELIGLLAKKFDWSFTFNVVFWGHIMNNNQDYATNVFAKDLKGKLDVDILRRIHTAAKANPSVYHNVFPMYNIFYFKALLKGENKSLKTAIESIFNAKKK